MHIGQTRIFVLNEARKISSARVTCNHLKNEEGLEFMVKCDYGAKSISITRKR